MRIAASLLALLIALVVALPGVAVAAPRAEPKVVLVVGPAGSATDRYREQAEEAARVAERYTSNVIRLYSPDATWPAVKEALDGAAIVVYLGHGNGWPSRYRDSLYGVTQNGFGLNPVAGGGDDAHQYFGEDRIAADVRLARNAVVLLHHLCYASGNTEPGLPEGTVAQARQRVDNYAAGFIRAGAGAVVAEGHMGPAWYMKRLLTGNASIRAIWDESPNRKGHTFSFESSRSPEFIASMDPDRKDSGFYRSIVYRGGVGAGQLEATAPAAAPAEPAEPTLIGTGLAMQPPYFKQRPLVGTDSELWIPYETRDAASLDGLTIGTRWDPIDLLVPLTAEPSADATAEPTPEPSADATAEPTPEPSAGPNADASPPAEAEPNAAPIEPPAGADPSTGRFRFIEPERIGSVVEPGAVRVGKTRIVAPLRVPDRPGRYRLVVTLHDASGVAYDAATQGAVPALIVRVSGNLDAQYLVTESAAASAGGTLDLPVAVANVGSKAWGYESLPDRPGLDAGGSSAELVAHWVRLAAPADGALPADTIVELRPGLGVNSTQRSVLALTAPSDRGTYLVVLDIVVPGIGSLTSQGIAPALVRVTVE